MPNLKQFKLPDLGEGLTEGEILKWLVQPGEDVKLNQPIVEVETAKAAVEVPSPYAGTVTELHFEEGTTVDVGTPIITFDVGGEGGAVQDNPKESAGAAVATASGEPTDAAGVPPSLVEHPPTDEAVEPGMIGGPAPGGRTSVLVGYGPRTTSAKRRPRKAGLDLTPPDKPGAGNGSAPAVPAPSTEPAGRPAPSAGDVAALAKPPVRKLARDLGVDLTSVTGSGPAGTITRADVEAAARSAGAGAQGAAEADESALPAVSAASAPPAFDPATREQRIPVKGVRKHTAAAMVSSAFTAPHVTEFVTVDVSPTMELLDRLRAMRQFQGVKVSPLLIVAKALLLAVRRNPTLNAVWDEANQEIVLKDYVNLGIAAATPRGLVVPNIKDAGRLTLVELAEAINALAATAREGKTQPADMQGGTITITNVGVFGVDTGTPIINPGESAILCLGAIRQQPWVHQGEIAIRWVTTLGLSFDHRLIDGQQGSQFLADVAAMLSDPMGFVLYS